MAVIPDVQVSTRQIETAPTPHYFQSLKGENGRVLGGAISHTGNAIDRIWEVQRRERERAKAEAERQAEKQRIEMERAQRAHEVSVNRDGENLNNIFENYIANEAIGRIEQDPKTGEKREIKGKWSTTYSQMQGDNTSLPKITDEIYSGFKETEDYKNATPEVRAVFERKAQFVKDRWTRKAMETQERLRVEDSIKKQKENEAFYARSAAATYGSKTKVIDPRTGAEMPAFQYAANEMGLKTFAGKMGSLVANPETMDNPTARFDDIKWTDNPDENELSRRRDAYQDEVRKIYVNRITALQNAGANGMGLGDYRTPQDCLIEADRMTDEMLNTKMNRKGIDGKPMTMIDENQANAVKAETDKARQLLEGKRAATHKIGARELAVDFKKRTQDIDDTRLFINSKTLPTKEDYNKGIDVLLANDKIDERTAEEYKSAYGKLIDYRDRLSKCVSEYERTGKGGVWTRIKDRNGKEIEVFQPDRPGNGKTETDPTIAAKYTMKDRNGNTPYFNNPAAGMEELDYDLRMGNISVPFYNAQMAALRVYSDTKAKTAFVKIFGAEATLFPDKDLPQYQKQGIGTSHKQLWAKNKWWAGNHNVGKNAETWQEDALKGDGGEYKVSLEQEAQICEMVLQLTAEGIDPTDAIQAYLAPTFDGWMKTDLSERLDPSKKIGGKTFRDWILESKRFNSAVGPRDREARLQARQKEAYGDITIKKNK